MEIVDNRLRPVLIKMSILPLFIVEQNLAGISAIMPVVFHLHLGTTYRLKAYIFVGNFKQDSRTIRLRPRPRVHKVLPCRILGVGNFFSKIAFKV